MTRYSYYVYQCEFGHRWVKRRTAEASEPASDTVCSHGHEAVTCSEQSPADRVLMLIEPAARVVDRARGQIGHDGMFWLVLLDHEMTELRRSNESYGWETATKLMQRFANKTKEQALKWWDRKPL